jgi:broad-specificity NMP kinase
VKDKVYIFDKEMLKSPFYEGLTHGSQINISFLAKYIYGVGLHIKTYKDPFDTDKVLTHLKKHAKILHSAEDVSIKPNTNEISSYDEFVLDASDKSIIYFYKDNFIKIAILSSPSRCSLVFYTPLGYENVDQEFLKYIHDHNEPNVYMVDQEYGDFIFSKFQISIPKTFDLELNYGEDFIEINNKIKDSLNKHSAGLYMFHGPPGTGKTTYIKYLASSLQKDVIFFPTSLVQEITNPSIMTLLRKKPNCVLVLEDAEKAITKRESNGESSLVSTLLNVTDGILGDVLKLNVIVTYNCDRNDIDEALLRKGRLRVEYSFNPLSKDMAQKIAKSINKENFEYFDDMTLADIYNTSSDDILIKGIKKLEKPRIGFIK